MRKVLIITIVIWAILCVAVLATHMPREEPVYEPEPEEILSPVVVSVQEPEPESEPEPVVVVTYPVPLEQELQDFIVQLCEEHHIEPGIVFAIIDRESDFRAHAVGDNGRSFGLMQIQKRWHTDRMERLGAVDLLHPYQNVAVGIDYLSELFNSGNGVEWALAAYNAGASGADKGYGLTYAQAVFRDSGTLTEGVITTVDYY